MWEESVDRGSESLYMSLHGEARFALCVYFVSTHSDFAYLIRNVPIKQFRFMYTKNITLFSNLLISRVLQL